MSSRVVAVVVVVVVVVPLDAREREFCEAYFVLFFVFL